MRSAARRVFSLAMLLAGLVPAPAGAAGDEVPRPARRPSILFAIADDWSWPHVGAYGDAAARTPAFDRLAADGILFTRAFCAAPSCTASRGAILAGQAIARLEEGGNLWSILPHRVPVFPDLLEASGYRVGFQGKGWGPGSLEGSGRTRNPAGRPFRGFREFLETVPAEAPFCFWFGSQDPHRPYVKGSGAAAGFRAADVRVPPFLPDRPEVRDDILDYLAEVERFDRDVGRLLEVLEASGRAADTIVVVTSDNGMPFPRAKANLYEAGTHMPLAVRWPARVRGGRTSEALVGFEDFAPTFLEAAGIAVPSAMTGRSFLGPLTGEGPPRRDAVFFARERHANVRAGDRSYPVRGVRTADFLYLRNLRPELWPAGDPERWRAVGPYGDIDGSPTKDLLLAGRDDPALTGLFRLAFDLRPAEELFDLSRDPFSMENLAGRPEWAARKRELRGLLDRWMDETGDPRARGDDDRWDRFPYHGEQSAR